MYHPKTSNVATQFFDERRTKNAYVSFHHKIRERDRKRNKREKEKKRKRKKKIDPNFALIHINFQSAIFALCPRTSF